MKTEERREETAWREMRARRMSKQKKTEGRYRLKGSWKTGEGLSCVTSVTTAHKSRTYRVRPRHSGGLIMKDGHEGGYRASRHAIDRDVRTRTLSLSLTLAPRRSVISCVVKTTPGLHSCTHYTSNSCKVGTVGSTTHLTSTVILGL